MKLVLITDCLKVNLKTRCLYLVALFLVLSAAAPEPG